MLIKHIVSVTDSENTMPKHLSPDVISALKGVRFIAQHIKDADKDNEVKNSLLTFSPRIISYRYNNSLLFVLARLVSKYFFYI